MFHSRGTVAHVKTRSEVSHELKMEKLFDTRETNVWIYIYICLDIFISLVTYIFWNRANAKNILILANLYFQQNNILSW